MSGMNKAKHIYIDENGKMMSQCTKREAEWFPNKYKKVDADGVIHRKNLTLVCYTWLNRGVTLWFEDDDGQMFPMTDSVFGEYLAKHPINIGEVDIEYLQRGQTYSIGIVGCD